MKFNSCWSFLFGVYVSSSAERSLCMPSGVLNSVNSPSEHWYRHCLPESGWIEELKHIICGIWHNLCGCMSDYYFLFMLLITKVKLSILLQCAKLHETGLTGVSCTHIFCSVFLT